MKREHIIAEIQRTAKANGGVALGWRRFEDETGIKHYDWFGQFWARWGDAVREAGLEVNRMSEAYDEAFLLRKLVDLTRRLARVPTQADIRLAPKLDSSFPTANVFRRLGSRTDRAARVLAFCQMTAGCEDVAALWQAITYPQVDEEEIPGTKPSDVGYVYLIQHGSRREYKIGRTNNPLRREGEIAVQLPDKLAPIHYIETDDPAGVESYWHARFAGKRKEGEWFSLTVEDVRAFKRWRCIY